nr:hypothetical protein [Croceibacterium ferulae]
MDQSIAVGHFDLDVTLRDAALDPESTPTRRMIANAAIGVETNDAYYSTCELLEALEAVLEVGGPRNKAKLATVLSNRCDDFQRCLYYCLAGRGIVQMLEDLEWLAAILKARGQIEGIEVRRHGRRPLPLVNPYVAAAPDGLLVSASADFQEGPSWWFDPKLPGIIDED